MIHEILIIPTQRSEFNKMTSQQIEKQTFSSVYLMKINLSLNVIAFKDI